MKVAIQVAGKSDVGLVRTNNEDNLGFDTGTGVFVVCDGMGGQNAGERASKIAVDTVMDYFRKAPKEGREVFGRVFERLSARANALARAIQLANQAIHEEAGRDTKYAGMGTTIVAIAVEGDEFSVAHVGDSRAYLLRGGVLQQLTNDHSLVMEQVRRGLLTPEDAEKSTIQNVIVRSLGAEESVDPDLADHELLPGDVLMMCSDGLSHFVHDNVLSEKLAANSSPELACDDLIQAAKTGASNDNITCLVLSATTPSWSERMLGRFRPGHSKTCESL
jgi:serine/threonine protein phosphatase PrpC